MTKQEILEYNKLVGEFMGWKFFESSKRGVDGYPFGGHEGFETTSVWIKNPTQKYIDDPCHTDYEYLDGTYNSDIDRKDLFDDYAYSLKYHSDWNWIISVVQKIKVSPITAERNGISDSITPYLDARRPIIRALIDVDMEGVVNGINQFLIWYNQNK